MLYTCRECGQQISSGASRCAFCGAPPRPPLHGRPWSHRLALRAALVLMLALPLLMLPLVLRWHNGSWDPCRWVAQEMAKGPSADGAVAGGTVAAASLVPVSSTSPAGMTTGQCLQRWLERGDR